MSSFLVGTLINDIHQFINLKYSNEKILYYSSYKKRIITDKIKSFFMITEYSKEIKNLNHKTINIPTLKNFNLEIKRELIIFNYFAIRGNVL